MEADPPAYVWSGVGDIDVPGDALVGSAATRYRGIGTLAGLPDLPALLNGTADRAEFSLSGVDAIAMGYALEDKLSIIGAIIRIGSILLDDHDQIAAPVDWEWEGRADTVSFDSQSQSGAGRVWAITIGAGTASTGRSSSDLSFFTDADQRQRSPTDAFFSFIAGISQTTSRRFGAR